MTQEQAIAAINELVSKKQLRKNSLAYKSIMMAIENPGLGIVCGSASGSGNFAGSKSWQAQCAAALRRTNIGFCAFNVSPRGGKAGDRITVNF